MSRSRKRQKELESLRSDAEALLRRQQEILSHATAVAKEAGRQAARITREEVVPRVKDGYENVVAPNARKAAHTAGDIINNQVIPAVGTVIGTAMSVADVAKDARVQAAVKRVKKSAPIKTVKKATKKKSGFGGTVGTILGIAALAGIAYAVWQTFRADDELWVADPAASSDSDGQQ